MKDFSPYKTAFHRIQEVTVEFAKNSDLGATIAASAFLEDILRELLSSFFVAASRKEDDSLFEGFGPLSSFRARIDLSYRLGLISKEEKRMLDAIRAIRNAFAHDLRTSFNVSPVKDHCRALEVPDSMIIPRHIPMPKTAKDSAPLPKLEKHPLAEPRRLFQESVINLMHRLAARLIQAKGQSRERPPEFVTATEPGRVLADSWRNLEERIGRLKSSAAELRQRGASKEADELEKELNAIAESKKQLEPLFQLQRYALDQIGAAHEARKQPP